MIDLTNKKVEELNVLIQKYKPVLELAKSEKDIPYLAHIIDISIKYINQNHNNLSVDWKAWAVYIIKRLYLNGKLENESDISKIIDGFIEFKKTDYERYCEDIVAATEYDRDCGFVFRYETKIGDY